MMQTTKTLICPFCGSSVKLQLVETDPHPCYETICVRSGLRIRMVVLSRRKIHCEFSAVSKKKQN